ncbi:MULTISPECIES: DUF4129 domain-containing protein [Thermomonospora]|uniref:Protein-glutamine gamma-glutamyltransferase-like C-terminal domain-containing protein n=1 Tax=Thermomonospora cellulosilytica TaxID=1411118 RepID=A0A7W3RBY6_9ACTN|nr:MULTISPECIES: DUF4129 domain-containing protein [Thermomonospora]MBA9007888.1 hypothetical protein [Thermomonospora cellulosilytica]
MRSDPIGREEARDLARRELDKGIYHRDEPSWLERAWREFDAWLDELLRQATNPTAPGEGGGWVSLLVVVLLLAAAVALLAWLMHGRWNIRSRRPPLLEEQPSTAADHRTAAERHAAAGQWAEAIRERLRAIARDLEERVILEPRPGRTADELAAEAGAALPDHAERLRDGVRIFDDVWYGDRPGTGEGYATLVALDEALRSAKPRAWSAERSGEQAGAPA